MTLDLSTHDAEIERPGDRWLVNEVLRQRIRFPVLPRSTGGRSFVIEYVYEPFAGEHVVPAHVHTQVEERFEILAGRARYRLGAREGTAGVGETVVMPAGIDHVHPWSASDDPLYVRQTAVAPIPDVEGMEASIQVALTVLGLAREGKVNAKGLPNLLQLSVLIAPTMPSAYLAGPPAWLQRVLFTSLAGVARALGYRQYYEKFGGIVNGELRLPPR